MIKRRIFITACSAAGVAALLLTAGCSGGSAGSEPEAGASSASDTTTASPSSPASDTPSAPAGDDESSEPDASPAGDSGAETARCLTPDLAGSVVAVEGGGSAGHTEVAIVLKNEAAAPCILQGWPGVSFVGDNNGTQIGAAATLDRSSQHDTVTLDPGTTAHANLSIANAQNYDDGCEQTTADGFRVYPPGEKRSLFVENDQLTLTACANPDDELLDVQAFQPGS